MGIETEYPFGYASSKAYSISWHRHLFWSGNKKLFKLIIISKECNEKSRVEYEMCNKQWVINEIFWEKAKKDHQLF